MSSLPFKTSITLEEDRFKISHEFGIRGHFCFELTCDPGFLRVSQVDHICRQLSPLISDVERVSLEVTIVPENPPNETDVARWLGLFRLFDGAQELELGIDCLRLLYKAHETTKMGQEVLPALRVLWLGGDTTVEP